VVEIIAGQKAYIIHYEIEFLSNHLIKSSFFLKLLNEELHHDSWRELGVFKDLRMKEANA
jgi:hypothetical protein